jgi:hypothetical protein
MHACRHTCIHTYTHTFLESIFIDQATLNGKRPNSPSGVKPAHTHTHRPACTHAWSRTREEDEEEDEDGEVVLPSAHRLMLDWPAQPIAPRSRRFHTALLRAVRVRLHIARAHTYSHAHNCTQLNVCVCVRACVCVCARARVCVCLRLCISAGTGLSGDPVAPSGWRPRRGDGRTRGRRRSSP